MGFMGGPVVDKHPVTGPPPFIGLGALRDAWKASNLARTSAGRPPPPAKDVLEAKGVLAGGRLAALIGPRGFELCPEMAWESDNERRDGTIRGARTDGEVGGDIENEETKGSGDAGEFGSSEGEDAIASEWRTGDEKCERSSERSFKPARIAVDRIVGTRLS